MLRAKGTTAQPDRPHARIERIGTLPEGFAELAADAEAAGSRMLAVLAEDWEAGTIRFDGPGEALFAARAGEALLGLCGMTRDPYAKGEAGVMRLRRLYVLRAARRAGIGRALVEAAAEHAREAGALRLRLRAPASAFAFCERSGFLRSVGENAATHVRHFGTLGQPFG